MTVKLINGKDENESESTWLERIKDKPLYYEDDEIDPSEDQGDNEEYPVCCRVCGHVTVEDEIHQCQCCDAHMCTDCYYHCHLSCPEHGIPYDDPFWQEKHMNNGSGCYTVYERNPIHRDRVYLYVDKEIADKVLDKWYDLVVAPMDKEFIAYSSAMIENSNPLWNRRAAWLSNWSEDDTEESVFKASMMDYMDSGYYQLDRENGMLPEFDETLINLAWKALKPVGDVYPDTAFVLGEHRVLKWKLN